MITNEQRIVEIDTEIEKQKSKRTIGIVLVIVSLFFLWPLMIVGIILWVQANKQINKLLDEKKQLQINSQNQIV